MKISFGANLILGNNLYKGLKTETQISSMQKLVEEFQRFLQQPNIAKITQNDTIELSRAKSRGSFGIEVKFPHDNGKVFEDNTIGVYGIKNKDLSNCSGLRFVTLQYLAFRTGEKPKCLETSVKYVKRVIADLIAKTPSE